MGVDALERGQRPGGLGQPVTEDAGVGGVPPVRGDVGRDVGPVGLDRHGLGEPDRDPARQLPQGCDLLGEQVTGVRPELHRVRASVAPGPVELDGTDRPGLARDEPDPDGRAPGVPTRGDLRNGVLGPDAVHLGGRRPGVVTLGHGRHRRHGATDGEPEGDDGDEQGPVPRLRPNRRDRPPVPSGVGLGMGMVHRCS